MEQNNKQPKKLNCQQSIDARGDLKICKMAVFLGLTDEVIYYAATRSQKWNTQKLLVIEWNKERYKDVESKKYEGLRKHPGFEVIFADNDLFKKLNEYLLNEQTYKHLRSFDFFYNFDVYEANKEKCNDILGIFKNCCVYTVMFYGNDAKDSLIGYQNMFSNIKEICNNPGINKLEHAYFGKPAIIIGAGPSLTNAMKKLKEVQDKAVLIAVDAALKPLLDNGIRPHFVTTLEREEEVAELFIDITPEKLVDTYLVACPVIFNSAFKAYKGKKIICYRQFDHFKWINVERGMLPIKTSPGNMNMNIAEYFGCDPIIMVGQDMALDGNITNVDGAVLGAAQRSYLVEQKYEVKGNMKDKVITTHFLKTVLDSFTVDVAKCISEVINTSNIGAYVENTKVMHLDEVCNKYLDSDVETIKEAKKRLNSFKKTDIAKAKKNIDVTINHFETCIEKCNKIIAILNAKGIDFKYKNKRIIKIKNEMVQNFIAWQLYFAHIAQSVFINYDLYFETLVQDYEMEESKERYLKSNIEHFGILKGLFNICIQDLEEFKKV